MASCFLHVFLKEAYGLAAMDLNGQSDPYCKIQYGDVSRKTDIVKRSLNPKWNRYFVFEVKEEEEKLPALQFTIFDYDVASADDIIGKNKINISPMWELFDG